MDIRFFLKHFLLFTYICMSNPLVLSRLAALDFGIGMGVYITLWTASLITFWWLAFQKYSHIKCVLSCLFLIASTMSINYFIVTRQYMEFYELEVMFHAANNLKDALTAFDGLWIGFSSALIGGAALMMPVKKMLPPKPLTAFSIIAGTLLAMIAILFAREGEGTRALPAHLTPIAYSMVLLEEYLLSGSQSDSISKLKLSGPAFQGDIVVIMDESIRGDFLDINREGGLPTGLNRNVSNIINFGLASSATNCSDTSNLSFRRGVSRKGYLTEIKYNPTVWRLAKESGYRTVYLDAQLTNGRLGNHMTEEEKDDIDIFYQVSDVAIEVMNKDIQLAHYLNSLLADSSNDFIYINKMGAHFPYEGKYPYEARRFTPVMEDSLFKKSYPEEGELPHPKDMSRTMRLKFLNSYKNALSWNVSTFFEALDTDQGRPPYVMFYTSDHGQTFHDDGRPGYGTHCSISKTDPEEGIVPFIVKSNDQKILDSFRAVREINFNKVSHFNIYPTIHALMGFDVKRHQNIESTVFEPLDQINQQFISKYFVRFGSSPILNDIKLDGRDSFDQWSVVTRNP